MFNDLIETSNEYLAIGNIAKASELLTQAWKHALGAPERKLAHALGNAIQREIFAQYELNEAS